MGSGGYSNGRNDFNECSKVHGWSNSGVVILAFRNTKILIRGKCKESLVSLRLFSLLRDHDPDGILIIHSVDSPRWTIGNSSTKRKTTLLAYSTRFHFHIRWKGGNIPPLSHDRDTAFILITFPTVLLNCPVFQDTPHQNCLLAWVIYDPNESSCSLKYETEK